MYDIIINAPNIHTGGGLTLLQSLFYGADKTGRCLLIINEKIIKIVEKSKNYDVRLVRHALNARIRNEFTLLKKSKHSKRVLMFGNLPPIFRLHCETILYVQNVYIIKSVTLAGFNWKQKFRIRIERIWFNLFRNNVDKFVVQTCSMKKFLESKMIKNIEVIPFIGHMDVQCNSKKEFDFIYPSSGEPHKNHRNLIEAWILLANEGIYPELYLTLNNDSFGKLCLWLDEKIKFHNLKIINIGQVNSHQDMLCYIKYSRCLIFPSLVESFGLPLVEAQFFKVAILAPEQDYVRDVVSPDETFDPNSAISIARAVKRHIGLKEFSLPIYAVKEFFEELGKDKAG